MRMLNGDNEYGIKVPYIFVTNGGGKTEQERCLLQMEVSPGQFICGHTPMREMVDKYNAVLVVGGEGEKCRQVAEGCGFKDVVTPGDIIKDNADTTPFRKLAAVEYSNSRLPNFADIEIEAILVFADSRDWASDQQIILDLLKTTAFGKPQIGTFQFATRLLRKDTHGIDSPPDTVYFVGDTPEFSKSVGNTWYSILARTGVFREGSTPRLPPRAVVDNVLEAVKHGMRREYRNAVRNAVKNAAMNASAEKCIFTSWLCTKQLRFRSQLGNTIGMSLAFLPKCSRYH